MGALAFVACINSALSWNSSSNTRPVHLFIILCSSYASAIGSSQVGEAYLPGENKSCERGRISTYLDSYTSDG